MAQHRAEKHERVKGNDLPAECGRRCSTQRHRGRGRRTTASQLRAARRDSLGASPAAGGGRESAEIVAVVGTLGSGAVGGGAEDEHEGRINVVRIGGGERRFQRDHRRRRGWPETARSAAATAPATESPRESRERGRGLGLGFCE